MFNIITLSTFSCYPGRRPYKWGSGGAVAPPSEDGAPEHFLKGRLGTLAVTLAACGRRRRAMWPSASRASGTHSSEGRAPSASFSAEHSGQGELCGNAQVRSWATLEAGRGATAPPAPPLERIFFIWRIQIWIGQPGKVPRNRNFRFRCFNFGGGRFLHILYQNSHT